MMMMIMSWAWAYSSLKLHFAHSTNVLIYVHELIHLGYIYKLVCAVHICTAVFFSTTFFAALSKSKSSHLKIVTQIKSGFSCLKVSSWNICIKQAFLLDPCTLVVVQVQKYKHAKKDAFGNHGHG